MSTLSARLGVLLVAAGLAVGTLGTGVADAAPPAGRGGSDTVTVQEVTPGAARPAAAAAPSAAHPYSDPVWFPLRAPARVSCVLSNCPGPYHGRWAIDFLGALDDPIYPAGAGVFHIGAVSETCPKSGVTSGTWVWVDHGPAGVTRYSHLNTVVAKEGQLVTPDTVIGTMGHYGEQAPCRTNYLHMEFRGERVSGPALPIPAMKACAGTSTVSLPSALGQSSWNGLPPNITQTASYGNDCLPSSWDQTPERPTITVQRGPRSVMVTPSARPASTTAVRVRREDYHPSLKAYGLPTYRTITATQRATTFGGLVDGRTYRFSVSFRNAAGWSAWAPARTAVPASPPATPRYRGLSASSTTMSYLWYRVTSYGTSAATYQVAKRCVVGSAYGPWAYATVPVPAISYQWRNLRRGTGCQVTVRAHNPIGWSGWSTRKAIRTRA